MFFFFNAGKYNKIELFFVSQRFTKKAQSFTKKILAGRCVFFVNTSVVFIPRF